MMAALVNGDFIDSEFPFEDIILQTSGRKVTGSAINANHGWWSHNIARQFYHSKKIATESDFDLIQWDGM